MKKCIYSLLIALTIISSFCFIGTLNIKDVCAENLVISNDIEGIVDDNLYNSLLWNNYNKYLPEGQREIYITKDMFANCEVLDLSGFNITSLLGLNLLNLSSLKELKLDNNNITVINQEVANALSNIQTLNLANNNLMHIDLSSYTNLNQLDISYNQLSEIDISMLTYNSENQINVNLMCNNIKTHEKISTDTDKKYNINLTFNKITNTDNDFFVNNNVDVYFQNTYSNTASTQSQLQVFNGYSMPDFNIKVLNANNQEVIKTLTPNTTTFLPAGDYILSFYNQEQPLYNVDNISSYAFKDISYTVIPTQPNFEIYINNEKVEQTDFNFTKPLLLKFSAEENAVIKISVNNGNYYTANQVKLTEKGDYKVSIISEINGKQSNVRNIYIKIKDKTILPVHLTIILVLCALFGVLISLKIFSQIKINFNKKEE